MSNEMAVIEQIIDALSQQVEKQTLFESEEEENRQTGLFTDVDYCSKINNEYEVIKKNILSRTSSLKIADLVSKPEDQTREHKEAESNSSRHRTDDTRFYDNVVVDPEEDDCFNLSEEIDKRDANLSRSYYDNLNNELQVDQIENEVSNPEEQVESCLAIKRENEKSTQEPFVLNETLLLRNEPPNVEHNLEKFERLLEKLTQMQEEVLNECELESELPKLVSDLHPNESAFDEFKDERDTLNNIIDQVVQAQTRTDHFEQVGQGTLRN